MTVERILIEVREDGARVVRRNLEDLEPAARRAAAGVDFLQKTLRAIGGILFAREILRLTDAMNVMENRLRSVGLEGGNLTAVYKELLAASNATRSSVEGSVQLFARLSTASKELGVSQRDLIDFTTSLNQAIVLSGATTLEANNALIQLAQGMASGVLRGDELRSVMEQLPTVADIIAKQLGVTRGELRKMGEQGKITASQIIEAFKASRNELEARFAKTVPTIGQSFTVLRNNLINFLGEADKTLGITRAISTALMFLSNNLNVIIPLVAGLASGLLAVGAAYVTISLIGKAFAILAALNPFVLFIAGLISATVLLASFKEQIDIGGGSVASLGDFFRAMGETVSEVLTNVKNWFNDTFGAALQGANDVWRGIDLSIVGILRSYASFFDMLLAAWRATVLVILTVWDKLPAALADIGIRAVNWVLESMAGLAQGIANIINRISVELGQGRLFKDPITAALIPNQYAGAAGRLGEGISDAIADGFRETPLADALERTITKADAAARVRQRDALRRLEAGATVGTQAGKAVPIKEKPTDLKKYENALRTLLNTIDPVNGALLELAKAERVLNDAVKHGLINGSQQARYLELARQHYKDAIDPLGAMNRELSEQVSLLALNSDERAIEADMLQRVAALRRDGVSLNQEELDGVRANLTALQRFNQETQIRDSLLAGSVGKRKEQVMQLEQMRRLLDDPSSGFTKGDAAVAINNSNQDLFAGTKTAMEAQVEANRQAYATIAELRRLDLIDEETMALARAKVAVIESEQRVANQRTLFSTLAGLANSENKKIAAIGKAAAITTATIDGVLAVQKALASAPPPYNYALAAAVGAVAAANVAQLAGFDKGGYTGDIGRGQVAGVVHGQEFVMNATATQRYRPVLDQMNAGRAAQIPQQGRSQQADGDTSDTNLTVINVLDESVIEDYLYGENGGRVLVNVIRSRSSEVKTALAE